MKPFVTLLLVLSVGAVGGTMVYLKHSKTKPPSDPVRSPTVEITTYDPEPAAEKPAPPPVSAPANAPTPTPTENRDDSMPIPAKPSTRPEMVVPETPHRHEIDRLVSAETDYKDRLTLLRQLKKSGDLKAVIAELQERASSNPNDAGIQVAIGEALMARFPVQDYNEMAMLGLQINQSFDAALKLDPANWEAQYSKALSLSQWPAEMNTGPQVIQQLTKLIDQQETMTPQSHFAQTYFLLGNQYRKAGQTEYALATWRLGLMKFPGDPALLQRIANP